VGFRQGSADSNLWCGEAASTSRTPRGSDHDRAFPLFGEHFPQPFQNRDDRLALELPEGLDRAFHVHRPKLIERHEAGATLKAASRTPRVRASSGRHGRNDHGTEMLVQLVRRHDHARPRLPDFMADRGIKSNQKDPAATDGDDSSSKLRAVQKGTDHGLGITDAQ
jgi:hypothetical protein